MEKGLRFAYFITTSIWPFAFVLFFYFMFYFSFFFVCLLHQTHDKHDQGMNCNPHVQTNNSIDLFTKLGISCTPDPENWWAEDQPSYVSDRSDGNYGKCVGYNNVPTGVQCGGMFPTTRRLCACDEPNSASPVAAFGTGLSGSFVDTTERTLLNWIVPSGTYGA